MLSHDTAVGMKASQAAAGKNDSRHVSEIPGAVQQNDRFQECMGCTLASPSQARPAPCCSSEHWASLCMGLQVHCGGQARSMPYQDKARLAAPNLMQPIHLCLRQVGVQACPAASQISKSSESQAQ
jgi:hypothetical protein